VSCCFGGSGVDDTALNETDLPSSSRARLAKIKQSQARALSTRARPLGRKLPSLSTSARLLEYDANMPHCRPRPCLRQALLLKT
jgi:hypothetical protein